MIWYADEKDKQQRWGGGPAEADDDDDVYGNLFVDGGLGESLLRVKAGEVIPLPCLTSRCTTPAPLN